MDREREAPGARCGCRCGCWRCPRWLVVSLSLVKGWLGVGGPAGKEEGLFTIPESEAWAAHG
jgi:hypothetical protein